MPEYIPGVCNIGPAEIAQRRHSGYLSLAIVLILFVGLIYFQAPAVYQLILFIPAAAAASGFLQAYFHFCAGFGFRGVYNLLKPAGQTETVTQQEFRAKDKQKALQIAGLSVLIGVVVTVVMYVLSF